MRDVDRQVHSIMEDNNLPDVPVVANKLLDRLKVEAKIEDLNDLVADLQEKMDSISEELDTLKKEKFHLEKDFDNLAIEKLELEKRVDEVEAEVSNKSVRVDICDKKLKIIELEGLYYISADQDYSKFERIGGKIRYVFYFPASMNVRQAVRKDFEKDDIAPVFEKKELKC
jgi:predicted nuclease with TOPRIM domain